VDDPLSCEFEAGTGTLLVSGSITESSVAYLRDALRQCSSDYTRDLTVDLAGVTFLPSVGLGALGLAKRRAAENGIRFVVSTTRTSLTHRILAIAGMPFVLRD
jgi:anti-anti-sigma factor